MDHRYGKDALAALSGCRETSWTRPAANAALGARTSIACERPDPPRPGGEGTHENVLNSASHEDADVTVLAEALDPDKRRVVLDESSWARVLDEHGEMEAHRDAVIATVSAPQYRRPDPRPARERDWRRGLGPSRWLLVVIDFSDDPARVVTAYANRKDPPGWTP